MPGYDLKTALQKMQQNRLNFALYRGEEGDQILITSGRPSGKQVTEVEKETGEGKRLLKGVCFRDESGLVFGTRNPAAPAWEKMLTKVLKDRKCSQFLPLSLRQLSPQEPEEISGDEPGAAPASSGSPGAAAADPARTEWERLKSSLMPQLRVAIADPASKEKVTKIVVAAQAFEKAGAYANATAIFQRLAGVLKLPVAPPAPVRAPKAGKLQAAMNRLTPAFKRAVVASPERREEILRPVVVFQQQLKDGELDDARETLRRVTRLLQSVLVAAA